MRTPYRLLSSATARFAIRTAQRLPGLVALVPGGLRRRIAGKLFSQANACRESHLLQGTRRIEGEPGINLFGMHDSPSGKGEGARGMAWAVAEAGIRSKTISFTEEHLFWNKRPPTPPVAPYAVNLCQVNADCIDAFLDLFGVEVFAGKYNIAYWAWELEDFPGRWERVANYFNEIWVPSGFVGHAITKVVRTPVVTIPHSIDIPQPRHAGKRAFDLPEDHPALLCMFDVASWPERKNPWAAIEAVARATGNGRQVRLVLKVRRGDGDLAFMRRLRKAVAECEHSILDRQLTREETWDLIDACDGLLSLHRSEGFGLILAEAMALGKPVIATGYSGNLDFMNDQNSLLVRYTRTRLPFDVGPYPAGAVWAEPDVAHAAEQICRWLDNPAWSSALAERARQDIRHRLSPGAVGGQIRDRLTYLGLLPDTCDAQQRDDHLGDRVE